LQYGNCDARCMSSECIRSQCLQEQEQEQVQSLVGSRSMSHVLLDLDRVGKNCDQSLTTKVVS
jgi:hypothetical protein